MPSANERSAHEKATLLFSTPEAGKQFSAEVREQLQQPQSTTIDRAREIVAENIAGHFAQAGEAVAMVKEPWLHTPAEHAEAQQLVDIAFAKDLAAALRVARASDHYPRNLDLFHDVLTDELYQLLRESKTNQQPIAGWLLAIAVVVVVVLLASVLVFVLT